MPALPPEMTTQILVDGVWQEVPTRITDGVTTSRGASSEGSTVQPAQSSATIDNTTGDYSPENPNSDLYGKIGRNTQARHGVFAGLPYLWVKGGNLDVAATPDTAQIDITGSIDVRIEVTLENFSQGTAVELAGRYSATAGQRAWLWLFGSNSDLLLRWSTDGTNTTQISSTTPVPVPASGRIALRSTLDASNSVVTHYTAPSLEGPWTQLGEASTAGAATSIFNSNLPLEVGSITGLGFAAPEGAIHRFELYDGIDGTLAAAPDFTAQEVGDTSFTDSTGLTWTLGGDAEITNLRKRIHGEVSEWPTRRDKSGANVTTSVTISGILRRLERPNTPLQSTLRRETTSPSKTAPVAYWPLEDGEDSKVFQAAVGTDMTFSGSPDLASFSDFACSEPLPVVKTGAGFVGRVGIYPVTGESQVYWLMHLPAGSLASGTVLLRVHTTGTASRWDVVYDTTGDLAVRAYDDSDTLLHDTGFIAFNADDLLQRWSLELTQDGADIDFTIAELQVGATTGTAFNGTVTSDTVGRITRIIYAPGQDVDDVAIGHVTVYNEITGIYDLADPLNAWRGEKAGRRIQRLCAENDVPFVSYTPSDLDDTQPMGDQLVDTLTNLLFEAADADRGMLLETRHTLGLTYRPLRTLYNQAPVLTLDFADGLIDDPFDPKPDDKLTENDVTVQRRGGASYQAVDETGPMSVQDPPNGVGRGYDKSYTLNLEHDQQPRDLAGWILHLGTHKGLRFPQITLNLANPRVYALIDDILRADVGDVIRLTNLPAYWGPDDVDLLIGGYSDDEADDAWMITFACLPARPYAQVGVRDSTAKRDTAGSELATGVDADDTTLSVSTTLGPLWTTDASHMPFDIVVGGERMTVTAISGASSPQDFTVTRSVNGIAKSHDAGAALRLFQPTVRGL